MRLKIVGQRPALERLRVDGTAEDDARLGSGSRSSSTAWSGGGPVRARYPQAMTWHAPASAAQATGLTLDALRYYEREGLIGPVDRDSAGRRRYSDDDLAWVGIVTCLREAGLGITDLRRFTELLRHSADPTDRVAFLRERRRELRARLRQTQAALAVLDDKIAYYAERDGQ